MIVIIIALRDLLKWIVKKKLNFHAALSKEVVENRGSPILLGASRVAIWIISIMMKNRDELIK